MIKHSHYYVIQSVENNPNTNNTYVDVMSVNAEEYHNNPQLKEWGYKVVAVFDSEQKANTLSYQLNTCEEQIILPELEDDSCVRATFSKEGANVRTYTIESTNNPEQECVVVHTNFIKGNKAIEIESPFATFFGTYEQCKNYLYEFYY